jgi:hypothetical protein
VYLPLGTPSCRSSSSCLTCASNAQRRAGDRPQSLPPLRHTVLHGSTPLVPSDLLILQHWFEQQGVCCGFRWLHIERTSGGTHVGAGKVHLCGQDAHVFRLGPLGRRPRWCDCVREHSEAWHSGGLVWVPGSGI